MEDYPPKDSDAVRWADAPFNKPTANIILKSSDDVHFRVRKGILAEASPVFDDMFTHANPSQMDLHENGSVADSPTPPQGYPALPSPTTDDPSTVYLHYPLPAVIRLFRTAAVPARVPHRSNPAHHRCPIALPIRIAHRSTWPHSIGPVMVYMANCNGDCTDADTSELEWVR